MELLGLLAILGFVGGLLAGMVGLGGGIILAPFLLYGPPAVGLASLDMKLVARLTILQSLFATAAAGMAHRRARLVHGGLVLWMGAAIAAASLCGAFLSEAEAVSATVLLGLLGALALLAALLMCRTLPKLPRAGELPADQVPFSRVRAIAVAVGVGFLGGMVGQSGAFLTIPLLVQVVRMPLRLAIGSSLGITFCSALAGSLGKLAGGGQIDWPLALALIAGALAGSQLGAYLSRRMSVVHLRYALAALIAASAGRIWYQVLT